MGPSLGLGGVGAAVSFEDVARVARGDGVALDTAARERLKKDSPAKGAKIAASEGGASLQQLAEGASWLSTPQARAALLARLLPLVNGRSKVRVGVIELLARLLQPGVALDDLLPSAVAEADALPHLAAALPQRGAAAAKAAGAELSSAEQAVVDSGVSSEECAALAAGQPVTAGVAAVAIADARELLTAIASVTALSAEALQADVSDSCLHVAVHTFLLCSTLHLPQLFIGCSRPLQPSGLGRRCPQSRYLKLANRITVRDGGVHASLQVAAFEPEAQEAMPVKSAVAAAEQLTSLLAGSKQVNPRKGGAGTVAGISAAPQVSINNCRGCMQLGA